MVYPAKREVLNEETFKAGDRIGYRPEDMMKWFIRFLQTDLDGLSEGDLLNLQYEVRFASIYGVPSSLKPWEGFPLVRSIPLRDLRLELASKAFLSIWQQQNAHALSVIAEHDRPVDVTFALPTMSIKVVPIRTEAGTRWLQIVEAADPGGPLSFAIAGIYSQFAHRIRHCPECRKTFLADRTNQNYCSGSCQTKAGTKRYRQSHGLVTSRKRGRPKQADHSSRSGSDRNTSHKRSRK